MQAQIKRDIRSGEHYNSLIPSCTHNDTVIVGHGKARLEDTLKLMQSMIHETQADTLLISKKLKGENRLATCKNIWHFVYNHIQYKMDKTGVEQVRRPSRTWADRNTGVDCDCYTVFISSLLSNLKIPHKMRITKYGGKGHFQHVYPIVPMGLKHITIDCVTDQFNYEVPYSDKRDIDLQHKTSLRNIAALSGVDTNAISLDALNQTRVPLWEVSKPVQQKQSYCMPVVANSAPSQTTKSGTTLSPLRFETNAPLKRIDEDSKFSLWDLVMLSSISVAAGIGVLKLMGRQKDKKLQKNKRIKKSATKK